MPSIEQDSVSNDGLREMQSISLGDYVIDLSWSPDGSRLGAVTVEGLVYLIHVSDNAMHYNQIGHHKAGANALSWRLDGQEFATAGQDGTVKIWDGESGQELCSLSISDPWVSKVAYNPKSKFLAASGGKILSVWDEDRSLVYESHDHASTISDLAWNPDGSGLAVAAYYGVTVHVPKNQSKPRKYKWKGSSLVLSWSPDAKYIATGEQDSTVHFWHRKSGEDARMWGFPTKVLELSWDASGRWLATGGGPIISLWDCSGPGPSGRQPRQFGGHRNKLTQLAFQPNGDLLASADADSLICLWDPIKNTQALHKDKLSSPATCLRWSKSGHLAAGQRDGSITTFSTTN